MSKTRAEKPRFTNRPRAWEDLALTLDTKEVCALLLCSDKTAHKLLNDGIIRGARVGSNYIFERDSLRDYILGNGRT